MRVGLLNPAPIGPTLKKWGDYQFGCSLADALTRLGATVEHKFWPEWDSLGAVDISITLRGKRAHRPRPGIVNVIWIISHPAAVSRSELQDYDLVLTAAETHRDMLAGELDCPVHVLRQCTDPTIFQTTGTVEYESMHRRDALFVANSRGIRRPILGAMLDEKFPVAIIGRHWGRVGLSRLVRKQFVKNDELADMYRSCRLALNDHWCDMKHFEIINNRIFDCLATGTPVITDSFPELERICGDALLYFDSPAALQSAILAFYFDYETMLERTRALWTRIGPDYTFDRRAQQILELAGGRKPRLSELQPRTRIAEPHAIFTDLDDLKAKFRLRTLQVLHVSPRPVLQHSLVARADINYVTAGVGVGPWLVDLVNLADGVHLFQKSRFHYVILEGSTASDAEPFWTLAADGGRIVLLDDSTVGAGIKPRALERV